MKPSDFRDIPSKAWLCLLPLQALLADASRCGSPLGRRGTEEEPAGAPLTHLLFSKSGSAKSWQC